jgi:hypothetical protein
VLSALVLLIVEPMVRRMLAETPLER